MTDQYDFHFNNYAKNATNSRFAAVWRPLAEANVWVSEHSIPARNSSFNYCICIHIALRKSWVSRKILNKKQKIHLRNTKKWMKKTLTIKSSVDESKTLSFRTTHPA